jgi:hypothetical protein
VQTYINIWKQIRPTIIDDIQNNLEEVYTKYKDVFDENMAIHNTKYPNEGMNTFLSQISEVKEKLIERIVLLDDLMKQYDDKTVINNIASNNSKNNHFYNLFGIKIDKPYSNSIYINNGKKYVVK